MRPTLLRYPSVAYVVVSSVLGGSSCCQNAEVTISTAVIEIPYDGPGKLVSIWSSGLSAVPSRVIVTSAKGSTEASIEGAIHARWSAPSELLIHTVLHPTSRILLWSTDGRTKLLSEGEGLQVPEPAVTKPVVAVLQRSPKGMAELQVRDVELNPIRSLAVAMKSVVREGEVLGHLSEPVWSPDKTHLAIAGLLYSPDVQRSVYRLFLLSEGGEEVKLFPEDAYPDPHGIYPLFWNRDGVYARSLRGLLRCDPDSEQCELVYELPWDRFAFAGRAIAPNEALLLVQDHGEHPYEARGKEIHRVDLSTGNGRVFLRAPDGVYVSDLDWIGDSER